MPRSGPAPTRWLPWVLRALWVAVAAVGGAAVGSALDDRSDPVRTVGGVGAAAGWVLGVAAMAVPATVSLTAVRALVPLALASVVATAVGGATGVEVAAFAVVAAVATVVALAGDLGRAFVQASAYGDEERYPLRPPLGYLVATLVSWVVWAAAVVAGPLLLAAGSWVAGALVTAAAVAGTVLLVPRWHRLSLRWLVLVPAGVVLHDPVVLAETLMLRRSQVAAMRLAPAGTGAADLTGPATGHAIEVAVGETVTAVLAATPATPRGRAIHLTAYLAAPTRPGQVLRAAADRRLPVG